VLNGDVVINDVQDFYIDSEHRLVSALHLQYIVVADVTDDACCLVCYGSFSG